MQTSRYRVRLRRRRRVWLLASLLLFGVAGCVCTSEELRLIVKRMAAEPRRIGAVAPTSQRASRLVASEALKAVNGTEDWVVELGPGTGCMTRALLAYGANTDRLLCVEMDSVLHRYMAEKFPDVQVFLGDATYLDKILGEKCGQVAAVVSAIPLKALPSEKGRAILSAGHAVLKPGGRMVQVTYGLRPPPTVSGFERHFGGFVLFNMPPMFVWVFTKVA